MIGKVLTLAVLYFVQGLPYGFQDKFIPMYLRSAGLSHANLSMMKMLLFPWICKAGYGPLLDLLWTKWLWLLMSLGILTLISFGGVFIDLNSIELLCAWLFVLNIFSALQDVSVDALALHILKECEMGHGNTAQVIGYKLGALFGGGVLFWVHHYFGWQYLCLLLTSLYILSIIVFLPMYMHSTSSSVASDYSELKDEQKDDDSIVEFIHSDETRESVNLGVRNVHSTKSDEISIRKRHGSSICRQHESQDSAEPPESENEGLGSSMKIDIFNIRKLVFATKGTLPTMIFLLFYKLGESGALSTFPIFLVDQGIPTKTIGFWSGIVGQLSSLLGSICSGWVISQKKDLKEFLCNVLVFRTIPIIVLWVIVNIWFCMLPSILQSFLFCVSTVSLIILEFTAGLVTTSVFTMMMSCSLKAPTSIQATHYSVLSSFELFGKLMLSSFSGALVDWLGLSNVYFMFVLLCGPPLIVLPFIEC